MCEGNLKINARSQVHTDELTRSTPPSPVPGHMQTGQTPMVSVSRAAGDILLLIMYYY